MTHADPSHPPLLAANLPNLPLLLRGKVRDVFSLGELPTPTGPVPALLFVATDRISAFDHVLASPIPDKGRILTQLSLFWFQQLRDLAPNHVLTAEPATYPDALLPYQDQLLGRSMVVRRAEMFPVECVVRGYLSGSGWKDYQATGTVCGIPLPAGLRESDELPEPIFTPAAKNHTGHDENISFDQMITRVGRDHADRLRERSMAIYRKARAHAAERGILLADTKFEFGLIADAAGVAQITLADEVLTPDSSRYWPADQYQPGGPTPSFDKQYVRDYLESIRWDKQPPAPGLPQEVVDRTRAKYLEALERITGPAKV